MCCDFPDNDLDPLSQDKSEEYDELKKLTQEQMIQSRSNNSQESTQLRQQLHEVTTQLASVHPQFNRSEELNLQLRWGTDMMGPHIEMGHGA